MSICILCKSISKIQSDGPSISNIYRSMIVSGHLYKILHRLRSAQLCSTCIPFHWPRWGVKITEEKVELPALFHLHFPKLVDASSLQGDTMPPSHPTSYPSPGVWWYLNKTHPWSHLLPAQLTAIHSRLWVLFETYFCPGEICECPNCHWKPQPQEIQEAVLQATRCWSHRMGLGVQSVQCSLVIYGPWCIKIWCSETSPELWKISWY